MELDRLVALDMTVESSSTLVLEGPSLVEAILDASTSDPVSGDIVCDEFDSDRSSDV